MSITNVKVWTDMGHLCYEPRDLPAHVTQQIWNDTEEHFETVQLSNGTQTTIRRITRKPSVPTHKTIQNYIINYNVPPKNESQVSQLKTQMISGSQFLCVIDNLFTTQQAQDLICKANKITNNGDNRAWHKPGTGGKYMRAIMIDRELANVLWNKIKHLLPDRVHDSRCGWVRPVYLNDHFRFSRYRSGGYFQMHCDGVNYDNSRPDITGPYSSVSMYTLNIFLNTEGMEPYELKGGSTSFYEGSIKGGTSHRYKAKARAGRACLFLADQLHSGDSVKSGYKYLLRTDVMTIPA